MKVFAFQRPSGEKLLKIVPESKEERVFLGTGFVPEDVSEDLLAIIVKLTGRGLSDYGEYPVGEGIITGVYDPVLGLEVVGKGKVKGSKRRAKKSPVDITVEK